VCAHGRVYSPRRRESEGGRRAAGERCTRGVLAERGGGMSITDAAVAVSMNRRGVVMWGRDARSGPELGAGRRKHSQLGTRR